MKDIGTLRFFPLRKTRTVRKVFVQVPGLYRVIQRTSAVNYLVEPITPSTERRVDGAERFMSAASMSSTTGDILGQDGLLKEGGICGAAIISGIGIGLSGIALLSLRTRAREPHLLVGTSSISDGNSYSK